MNLTLRSQLKRWKKGKAADEKGRKCNKKKENRYQKKINKEG